MELIADTFKQGGLPISNNVKKELYALNEPDESYPLVQHQKDYIHVHSCGIYPNIETEFSRSGGSPDYMLTFIAKGSAYFNAGDTANGPFAKVDNGGVVIYKPHEPQYLKNFSPVISRCWIHFLGYGIPELLKTCRLDTQRFYTVMDTQKIEMMFLTIIKEMQSGLEFREIKCNAHLIDLLSEIARQNKTNAKKHNNILHIRLSPAMDTINTQYHSDLSVEALAELCGLSKYHFIRLFKSYTNLSPHAYLTRLRVNCSKELLLSTDMKIGSIAEAVGFKDPLYFSKVFSKYTGKTPLEYRHQS